MPRLPKGSGAAFAAFAAGAAVVTAVVHGTRKSRIAELQGRIKSLTNQLEEEKSSTDTANKKVQELETELQSLQAQVAALTRDQNAEADLQQRLNDVTAQRNTSAADLSTANADKIALQAASRQVEQRLSNAKADADADKAEKALLVARLEGRLSSLQQELAEAQRQCSALEVTKQDQGQQIDGLQGGTVELEKSLERLKQEAAAAKADISRANDFKEEQARNIAGLVSSNQWHALRVGTLEGSTVALQTMVDSLKQEAASAKVAADGERRALQLRLDNNQALLSESEASLTAARNKEQELHLKVTNVDAERAAFENDLAHLENSLGEVQADAGREQQRLQQELVSVRADLSTAEQTIQHVTAQVTQLEGLTYAHVDEKASLKAEVTNLRESLQAEQAQSAANVQASQELASLEQLQGFHNRTEEERRAVQKELSSLTASLISAQVAAGVEKRALQEQMESSQEALYSCKASLAAAHNEKQQLQERLQSRQAAEEQLWGRINNMVVEHAEFEQTIAGLQASLKSSEASHAAAETRHQEDLDMVRAQLKTAEETSLQLATEVSTTRGEVISMTARLAAAQVAHAAAQQQHQEDLDTVRAQLQTAEHTASQLTGQLSTTQGEVTSLRDDLTAAQAEKSQSDGELLAAQQRVEQLTAQAEQLQASQSQEGKALSALQAELSSLKGHLKSGQTEREQLKQVLAAEKQKSGKKRLEEQETVNRHNKELKAAQVAQATVEQELTNWQTRAETAKKKLQDEKMQLEDKLKQFTTSAAERDNTARELTKKLNAQVNPLKKEVKGLKADLAERMQQLSAKDEQLSQLQPVSARLQVVEANFAQQTADLQRVRTELQNASTHIRQLESAAVKQAQQHANSHAAASQLSELQQVHGQCQPKRAALAEGLQQAQLKIHSLEQQLKAVGEGYAAGQGHIGAVQPLGHRSPMQHSSRLSADGAPLGFTPMPAPNHPTPLQPDPSAATSDINSLLAQLRPSSTPMSIPVAAHALQQSRNMPHTPAQPPPPYLPGSCRPKAGIMPYMPPDYSTQAQPVQAVSTTSQAAVEQARVPWYPTPPQPAVNPTPPQPVVAASQFDVQPEASIDDRMVLVGVPQSVKLLVDMKYGKDDVSERYLQDHATLAHKRGWQIIISIKGDGDCGYRAIAVGLAVALHSHPNAPEALPAFSQHMQWLCQQIPPDFLTAQKPGPSGANVHLGYKFFQWLLAGSPGASPAQLIQLCQQNDRECESLVLLFRAVAASLMLLKDPAAFGIVTYDTAAAQGYKPKDWQEYALNLVLQRCDNSRGDDLDFALKACSEVTLGTLTEHLHVSFLVPKVDVVGEADVDFVDESSQPCAWAGTTVHLTNAHDHYCLAL